MFKEKTNKKMTYLIYRTNIGTVGVYTIYMLGVTQGNCICDALSIDNSLQHGT